jgi:hypothetical protein
MQILLLLAGLAGAVAGAGMIGYGVLNPAVRFADTAILAGTIAIVGGVAAIGLSAAVARLQRIAEMLELQPMRSGPVIEPAGTIPEPPRPNTAGLAAVSQALGPLEAHRTEPTPTNAAPEVRRPEPEAPSSASAPPLGAAPAPLAVPSPMNAWASGNADEPAPASAEGRPPPVIIPPRADAVAQSPPAPTETECEATEEAVRVLKSGVIEGMAYTLYSDGSVDAEMRGGTEHFASIAEWRARLRESA